MGDQQPVLVTGSHRSGSTWVGRLLAGADELHYVQEPFNIVAHQRWMHPRPDVQFLHVTSATEAPWLAPVQRVLDLDYPLAAHLARRPGLKMSKRATRVALEARQARRGGAAALVKDPIAVFSTPWLAERFGVRPVVLVRDAVPFVGSLRERDWSFDFTHWTRQPTLMATVAPWAERVEALAAQPGDIVEQAIVMWNVIYDFVAQLPAVAPGAIVVSYEAIASNPQVEVEALFGRLGLDFGAAQRDLVTELSSAGDAAGQSAIDVRRDSAAVLDTWRERLGHDEIERIRSATAEVAERIATVV